MTELSIAEKVAVVRDRMAEACLQAGRPVSSVRLIAVTKYVEETRIAEAIASGVREVGENHAQELTQKLTFFKLNGVTPHFIGQLQTNKIKYVCGKVALVHSVDRLPLALQLEKRAAGLGIVQDILLQVNIGAENQKGGMETGMLMDLIGGVSAFPHLCIRGLMCVPPNVDPAEARRYFARMRQLLSDAQSAYPALSLEELSMGMSADYPEAILEGATMVRVGSGIFGARNYGQKPINQ